MPIIYCVVARGPKILAKYASCAGNFAEVTEQILSKLSTEDGKLTYSHGRYLFHYVTEKLITYLCITDDDFERSRAFAFLNEIKRRFQNTYGARAQTALPYAMNSDFSVVLAAEMKAYSSEQQQLSPAAVAATTSTSTGGGRVAQVQSQVEDLKNILVKNIDTLADRGEKLELLIDRSQNLEASSVSFRSTSRTLSRHLFLKNIKLTIIGACIFAVILFIVITASCGGFTYSKCR